MKGAFLEDLTWPRAAAWIDSGAPVLIPVGAAAKEHGHHLPLGTDACVARWLATAVAERLPVLIAPVVGFGYYPAFRNYPGSQHLRPETFIALLTDLLDGLVAQGARNIAMINTGVSTVEPIRIAVREARHRHRIRVPVADIERLGQAADHLFEQRLGGHGDEQETSMMLAISPERVHMDEARTDYGHMLDQPDTVFVQPTVFSDDPQGGIDWSETGVRGDPTLATASKGRAALDAMVEDLVAGLEVLFPSVRG